MTLSQALSWIANDWRTSPYAKTETAGFGIDVDGNFGFQCVDFPTAYSIFLGAPFNGGAVRNAITLWTVTQPGWTKVANPLPGDVFVKDYVAPDGIDYGHTGCVQSVALDGIWSIDQNWYNSSLTIGSPPRLVFHPFSTIKGYLRYNDFKEGDMPTQEQVLSAFRQYGLPDPTQDQLDFYSKNPWSKLVEDLFNYVSANETLDSTAVNNGFMLTFGRPATSQEIAYWSKKNPGAFLQALINTKPAATTKGEVLDYLNKNLA